MEVKFNINNYVQVKLTEAGMQQWMNFINGEKIDNKFMSNDILKQLILTKEKIMERQLTNGYWEFPLYDLMRIFGEYMYIGNGELPFETEIVMTVKLDRKNKIEKFLIDNES